MDKTIFVIIIAIVATLLSTMLPFFLRGREVSPAIRQFLIATFMVGVAALIITLVLVVIR